MKRERRDIVKDVVISLKSAHDYESAVKAEVAKSFWQYDVSSRRRPKASQEVSRVMTEKYDWEQHSARVHEQAEAEAAVRRESYRGAPRRYVDPLAASEREVDDWTSHYDNGGKLESGRTVIEGPNGPIPVNYSERDVDDAPESADSDSIFSGPEHSPVARAFGAYMTGVMTGVFVPLAFMAAIPLGCIVLCISFIAVMSVYAIRDGRGMS